MELFDLGELACKVPVSRPMPERFIVAAYRSGKDGYWRIWNDLWFTREKAEADAAKLAPCWVDRRIYRIPPDPERRQDDRTEESAACPLPAP